MCVRLSATPQGSDIIKNITFSLATGISSSIFMAQKWYNKASVQSSIVNALIGVIPATIVGVATIVVQINLANKQINLSIQASKDQERKDDIAAVRAAKRYSSDSLLATKGLELNKFQFELERDKRKDDIALNERLERINNTQLKISENQYSIQKKRAESQAVNDLLKFGLAVNKLGDLLPDKELTIEDFKGSNSWAKKVTNLLESQLENPTLQEDRDLFDKWVTEIGGLNSMYWVYNTNPNFKYVSVDSLKKYVVQHPEELQVFKIFEKQITELFNDSNNFYTEGTSKRMGTPRIRIETSN